MTMRLGSQLKSRSTASNAGALIQGRFALWPHRFGCKFPPTQLPLKRETQRSQPHHHPDDRAALAAGRVHAASPPGNGAPVELPAPLTTAAEISHLKHQEADRGLPAKIRGVVTCIVTQHNAFVIQDATCGVFIRDEGEVPHVGELWEVEGVTAKGSFAPICLRNRKPFRNRYFTCTHHPGIGIRSSTAVWTINSCVCGVVESATYDPGGWSWIMLRTEGGVVRVDLPASEVTAEQLGRYNKMSYIEGCFFARTDPETGGCGWIKCGSVAR